MFVDHLISLYPGSNLVINGRKSQGSAVILRICLSCAVEWKEEMAAKHGKRAHNFLKRVRCAPLPVSLVAAHVNLGIAFNFCVPC